jgi:mannonate dehydratase
MNLTDTNLNLPEQALRWFGPADSVPLSYIRQAGATAVFTSLHEIPYGELWPVESIRGRKNDLQSAGLRWSVVESVPVHEDIKTGRGDLKQLLHNYAQSLRNLAAEGITTVVYNFMPVLDWIRTDLKHVLPDGSQCLRYDPAQFSAFEIQALQRPGAEAGYTPDQIERGRSWWQRMDDQSQRIFVQSIIDVFPGVKLGLGLDDIRAMLARYTHLRPGDLENNLARFHEAVVPVAEHVGVNLAIHPDDPPFPVLGLPRIVSTAQQVRSMFARVPSLSNGLCFCTGSFSANPSNDLPGMFREFAPRVHAVHLRSTQRWQDGSFSEADHLGGSVDMPAIMEAMLGEQDRRKSLGRIDGQLPFRPDHGHAMMDDLEKTVPITPGYTCIGRMRGLAELRGLMLGLRYARHSDGAAPKTTTLP